ncbi:putative tributyrin esterase [Pilibacter termitis]|uniref:Putative tributyrin esterase n=1 Tax=Pilibacter termitis TaxID=263852 RepID=A0A1T4L4D5_9ENTE|nr:alpha/beta hydrolase family protein [Pilibacter termitis]SJZ49579.1 putative tributyrin esterase [Pilibacter termitis]
MEFLEINYYSETLHMEQSMNIILPEKSDRNPDWTVESLQDLPALYLLHGMSGNHSMWARRTNIERIIRMTKIAVIMPSTDLAWYTNTTYDLHYFDALAKELPNKIQQLFPQISTKPEKNFVCGMSMGGYGAWKLALGTTQFSYAASLSGALVFGNDEPFPFGPKEYWQGIFGDLKQIHGSENDLFTLAEKRKQSSTPIPKLFSWCGRQDFLFDNNNQAVEKMQALNYDVEYQINDGTHEWYYWEKYLENVLEWLPIDFVREERLS